MPSNGIEKVLNFWFGKPGSADYLQPKLFWYGDAEADKKVTSALQADYVEASKGNYDSWKLSANGCLALLVLLDQAPRNMYRDTPKAYDTDSKALEIAKLILEKGWDKDQPAPIRRYMYSPFNHSENMADQEVSLRLYKSLGMPEAEYWGKHHHDEIKEHGRFRHRDVILGRNGAEKSEN